MERELVNSCPLEEKKVFTLKENVMIEMGS